MKIKEGFVVRDIMGQCVVVATGEASENFAGMIKLNDTGRDIWEAVSAGKSEAEIVEQIVDDYDVERDRAEASVKKFIDDMREKGFIID